MNPPLPVMPAPAWTTAWPAWLAALALLLALWLCRRDLLPGRRRALAFAGLALVAAFIRLLWIPAWSEHLYDGHEADYLDFFLGVKSPTRGGTVLYPSMQWLYWLLGHLVHSPWWPLLLALVASVLSIWLAAALGDRLFRAPTGLFVGLLMAFYGNHAFWSSSAYNVMIPFMLGMLLLWSVLRLTESGLVRFALLAASSGALMVATRLEMVVLLVPVSILLVTRWPRAAWRWLPVLVLGGFTALCAVVPLVWPGGMPGSGERLLSFPLNVGMLIYLAPWDLPVVPLVAMIGFLPRFSLSKTALGALWATALAVHLVMATFDDYGYRHALLAGAALLLLCAASLAALWREGIPGRVLSGGLLLLLIGACIIDIRDISSRYYMSEADYHARLPSDLSVVALEEARLCAIVSEDSRISGEPTLSHFNLLDPREEARIRAERGCIRWCPELQDARWSSRAVRDRSLRLAALFSLQERAVLVDEESGYRCLLLDVGPRASLPILRLSWLPAPVRLP